MLSMATGDNTSLTSGTGSRQQIPRPSTPLCVNVEDDEKNVASDTDESGLGSSIQKSKFARYVTSSSTVTSSSVVNCNLTASSPITVTTVTSAVRPMSPPGSRFTGSSRDSVIVPHVDLDLAISSSINDATTLDHSSQAFSLIHQVKKSLSQQNSQTTIGRTNFSISSILGPAKTARHQKTTPDKRRQQEQLPVSDCETFPADTISVREGVSSVSMTSETQFKSSDSSSLQSNGIFSERHRRGCSYTRAVGLNDDVIDDKASRTIDPTSRRSTSCGHPGPLQLVTEGGLSEAVRHLIERQLLAGKLAAAAAAAAASSAGAGAGSESSSSGAGPGAPNIWHPTTSAASWLHHQLPASILHRRLMADIAAGNYSVIIIIACYFV